MYMTSHVLIMFIVCIITSFPIQLEDTVKCYVSQFGSMKLLLCT